MYRKIAGGGLLALAALLIAFVVVAYSYLRPAEAASEPIRAVAISATATTGGATGLTTYTIEQASSEARFVIDEVLNGSPFTVVGTTDQVAGQIALAPTNPSTAQVGTIQINARTLATDSAQRDNAIKNRVLLTNDNEYITFVPTSIVGLPTSATAGESYSFQIVGQLTIAGQTHEATFAATATVGTDGKLAGTATTTIAYADWGISIPQVPIVTGVADTATLQLDFVATAQ